MNNDLNEYTNDCNNDCLCQVIKCLIDICESGPTGPQGATGPTGPKAESFQSYAMVHDLSNSTVPTQNPILFQNTNLSSKISYSPITGDFSIPEKGIYIIHWWVNVRNKGKDCEDKALSIEFRKFWPNVELIAHSSTHNKVSCCQTGTINGNAIFEATAGGSYRLVNASEVDFDLVPNDLYSGCVSITRIN